jgi:death-on-curing family protein
MYFLHAEIEKEYKRWQNIVGPDDPYQSNDTIGLQDVLAAHFLIIDYFVEKNYGIGGVGLRNVDLLHSALSRQFTGYGGVRKWNGLFEHCATLMFGLIMNHPFHDANKRTALLAILSLLHRNKKIITLQQKKLDRLVIAVASNELPGYLGEEERYHKKLQSLSK